MNLGQMIMVLGALSLLGALVLNTNTGLMETNQTMNNSEFGITAVSLATSLVEEAMGKMYDQVIADSTSGALTDPSQLSVVLGPGTGEAYRGALPFNDFDDFNGLFLVYKSDKLADAPTTPGSSYEYVVPGLHAKYFVKAKVNYVNYQHLNDTSAVRTWHKKITVTVTSPSCKDTLVFPAIMSYWN
jgi:hypothetical protein